MRRGPGGADENPLISTSRGKCMGEHAMQPGVPPGRSLISTSRQRRGRGAGHGASSLLFVLILFGVMLLTGVMLIAMGTGVYENVLTSMDANDNSRTAPAYIRQKIRQAGDAGAVSAGELDGCDAIVIRESIGGETYLIYLYCDDGSLKELLIREGNASISASAGSDILDLSGMSVSASEDGASILVTLTLTDGTQQLLRIRTPQRSS